MKRVLKKQLKSRHLQMMALGGVIGTGLFLSTAKTIHITGPSLILSYLLCGMIIYIILRSLGEITVYDPIAGSFSEYANKYLGSYAGYIVGWSAWFEYSVVSMAELTAVSILFDYFHPTQHWLLCLCILVIFTTVNLLNIKIFGEIEFWLSFIKITAILSMLFFSGYLLLFKKALNPEIMNYKNMNVFFAGGLHGFLVSLILVIFSFGGSEFVAIAGAETENPNVNIPLAIKGVIVKIILFYILTILMIILLYPFDKLSTNISPFVDVFKKIGFSSASSIINLVAISAALSSLNTTIYSGTRLLYNLSINKHAPKLLSVLSKNSVPIYALLATSFFIALTVLINYLWPEKAFFYLMTITTSIMLLVWLIILLTQFKFRKMINKNIKLSYPSILYPYANICVIIILLCLAAIMTQLKDMMYAIYIIPFWILLLTIFYFITKKYRNE